MLQHEQQQCISCFHPQMSVALPPRLHQAASLSHTPPFTSERYHGIETNSCAVKWSQLRVTQECARFAEILQNFRERQILWSLCSVVFHALTLKLPIQTSVSVVPELTVSLSLQENCPNFRKRGHPSLKNVKMVITFLFPFCRPYVHRHESIISLPILSCKDTSLYCEKSENQQYTCILKASSKYTVGTSC